MIIPTKNIIRLAAVGFFLILLAACGGGGSDNGGGDNPPPSQPNIIGPAGGTYTSPDGVTIMIPSGALTKETVLTVDLYTDKGQLPLAIAGNFGFAGAVHFSPHGLQFEKPVTIRIPLTTQLPALTQLSLFYFTNSPPSWSQTPFIGTVDMTGITLTAEITHFSTFTVFYSQTDAAELGLFGNFMTNANETNYLTELNAVIVNFSNKFPIGGRMIHNLKWDVSNPDNKNLKYPDWWPADAPPPIAQTPPGYHCYETIGMQVVLIHSVSEEVIALPFGQETGADIHFVYSTVRDSQTRQGSEEGQFAGELYVTLLLRAVAPDFTLTAGDNHISLGESTGLAAKLSCNEEPMVDQELVFAMGEPVLGEVTPLAGNTDGSGIVSATFSAAPEPGGEQLLAAAYRCCVGTDHPEDVLATTVIDIGETLEVDPARIHLLKDESFSFGATLRNPLGEDITSNPFNWSSDDISLCTVNPEVDYDSMITAVGDLGVATITVDDPESLASTTAKVLVGATVELEPAEQCLVRDLQNSTITTQLTATVRDPEGTIIDYYNLQWASSDISRAMVDNFGTVAILDGGQVEIEAKIDYPGTGNYRGTALINAPAFPGDYAAEQLTQNYSGEDYILLNGRGIMSRLFFESYVEQQLSGCGYNVNTLSYWVDDINNKNQIVGGMYTAAGSRGFIIDLNSCDEQLFDPPADMAGFEAARFKINDIGQVLLHAWNNPVLCPGAATPYELYYPSYAYIYEDGVYTQIKQSDWTYTYVYDFNNTGQAVGYGSNGCNPDGDDTPFVYDNNVFNFYPSSQLFTTINDEGLIVGMQFTVAPAPPGVVDYFIMHYPTEQTWWRATDIPLMSQLLTPPNPSALLGLPGFLINNERDILVYQPAFGGTQFYLFHLCPLTEQQIHL